LCKFVVNFFVLFAATSCGPALIWNIPAQDLPGLIASGDTAYLENLDLSQAVLSEIVQNGPGSAYFHAYLARKVGREDLFAPLLEVEWQEGERPGRLVAGEELARYYIETDRYAEAETVAAGLLAAEVKDQYRRLHVEALYWQQRDEEVLAALDEFDFRGSADLDGESIRELELFRAVSSARLAEPGWKGLMLDFFSAGRPSSLHYRALRFIENGRREAFSAEEMAFMNAVVAVADNRYAEAVPVLRDLLEEPAGFLQERIPVSAAYLAFRHGGGAGTGARLFENLVEAGGEERTGPAFFELYEAAALLYFAAGNYRKAEEFFQSALEVSTEDARRDRMRWYLLRSAFSTSVDGALELVPKITGSLADPAYFTDIFNALLTRLVAERRWRDIYDFHIQTAEGVAREIRARSAYLCAAALREGFLDSAEGVGSVPGNLERSAEILLGDAAADGGMYYGILASAILGVLPDALSITNAPVENPEGPGLDDMLATGFITYGLLDYALKLALDAGHSLSDSTLFLLARALSGAGDIYNSMRVMDILRNRPSYRPTREAVELSYPRPYREDIEAAAQRDGVPPYLLYALIREESYFNPGIVSRSGAVGLSQLMPATAADTARRMGIALPPLSDAAANISIGSYYFAQMLGRFGAPVAAVFAYNAGPSRMISWKREYAGLPEDLLLEALPIDETQDHGRKVFSSAVMYGYLYYGVMPAQTAEYYLSYKEKGSAPHESR